MATASQTPTSDHKHGKHNRRRPRHLYVSTTFPALGGSWLSTSLRAGVGPFLGFRLLRQQSIAGFIGRGPEHCAFRFGAFRSGLWEHFSSAGSLVMNVRWGGGLTKSDEITCRALESMVVSREGALVCVLRLESWRTDVSSGLA